MTESSHSGWHPCLAAQRATSTSTKTQDLGRAGSYAGGAVVGLGAARKPRGSRCLNCGAFPIHAPTTPLILPLLPLFAVIPSIDLWHAREDRSNLYDQQQQPNRVSGSQTARLAIVRFSPHGNATPFPLQHSILLCQDQDSRQSRPITNPRESGYFWKRP